jgi:hypothetical protein
MSGAKSSQRAVGRSTTADRGGLLAGLARRLVVQAHESPSFTREYRRVKAQAKTRPSLHGGPASFARKCHELLGLTGIALDPQKSMLEQAALESRTKISSLRRTQQIPKGPTRGPFGIWRARQDWLRSPQGDLRGYAPFSHRENAQIAAQFVEQNSLLGRHTSTSEKSPTRGLLLLVWRARQDSNLRPLPSEGSTLSS